MEIQKMSLTTWQDKLYSGSTQGLIKIWVDGRLEEQKKILLIQSLNHCESFLQEKRNLIDKIKENVNEKDCQTVIDELRAIDIQIIMTSLEKIATNHLSLESYQNEIIMEKEVLKKRCKDMIEEIQELITLIRSLYTCKSSLQQQRNAIDEIKKKISKTDCQTLINELQIVITQLEKTPTNSLSLESYQNEIIMEKEVLKKRCKDMIEEIQAIHNELSQTKERTTMEQFISAELSRVMTSAQNELSKTLNGQLVDAVMQLGGDISNMKETIVHNVNGVGEKVQSVIDDVKIVGQDVKAGFEKMDTAFILFRYRLANLERQMEITDAKLGEISNKVTDIQTETEQLIKDINSIEERTGNIMEHVVEIQEDTTNSRKEQFKLAKRLKDHITKSLSDVHDCLKQMFGKDQEHLIETLKNEMVKKCDEISSHEDAKKLLENLSSTVASVHDRLNEIQTKVEDLALKVENNSFFSLLELKKVLMKQKEDLNANMNLSHKELQQKLNHLQSFIETSDNQSIEWRKNNESLKIDDVKGLINKLEEKVDKKFKELSGDNLAQYTEMKLIMNQIQISIPNYNDRLKLEEFISKELSRFMICVQNQSSKTEIANLRDTLLHQLCVQDNSLEAIKDQLENGLTTIHDSLEEVYLKLDLLTQSMTDFQLDLCSQLGNLKEEEIDLEDIERIMDISKDIDGKIQNLLHTKKKLKNNNVMTLILSSIPCINASLQPLSLSNEEYLTQLQSAFEEKCKESKEDRAQLESVLVDLSQITTALNEKMDSLTENVINIKTELFELDLSKFQKDQKEEVQNVYALLKEINENDSYEQKHDELLEKLKQSQSQLLQEMKDKLDANDNEDMHENLQQNVLQNLQCQLHSLLIQQERQTEIMIEFIKGQYDLPKYFTMVPKAVIQDNSTSGKIKQIFHYFQSPSQLGKTKFKLFFHCGCCKRLSLSGEKKTGYTILDASMFQKFAPLIRITLGLIRLSGATIGFPFPTSNQVLEELDDISTKFIGEDYGEEFNEKIKEIFNRKDFLSMKLELNGDLKQVTDKCYRQLKALMEKIDPQLENTGLAKIEGGYDGSEKSIEWVCESCKVGFQAKGKNHQPVSGA